MYIHVLYGQLSMAYIHTHTYIYVCKYIYIPVIYPFAFCLCDTIRKTLTLGRPRKDISKLHDTRYVKDI